MMEPIERHILEHFKQLVAGRLPLHQMILFGSRARGDAVPDSDMDVLVVLEGEASEEDHRIVYHCAWEAGIEHGIIVAPVVYGKAEWEEGPERYSLLAMSIQQDGILI